MSTGPLRSHQTTIAKGATSRRPLALIIRRPHLFLCWPSLLQVETSGPEATSKPSRKRAACEKTHGQEAHDEGLPQPRGDTHIIR